MLPIWVPQFWQLPDSKMTIQILSTFGTTRQLISSTHAGGLLLTAITCSGIVEGYVGVPLWSLLTGGHCSEVMHVFENGIQNGGHCRKVFALQKWLADPVWLNMNTPKNVFKKGQNDNLLTFDSGFTRF